MENNTSSDLVFKIITALIALAGIIYAWLKDLELKRKTYADKIRDSAGEVVAKLERRKFIMLSFYQEMQPLITDADILFVQSKDVIVTRDKFWKDIIGIHNSVQSKILDEKIEVAYISLIGYQPSIMKFYQDRISLLSKIDDEIKVSALTKTQRIILEQDKKDAESATLGNLLRWEMRDEHKNYEVQIDAAILDISNDLVKLIGKSDNEIYAKK